MILTMRGDPEAARRVVSWGQRLAQATGRELTHAPRFATGHEVLDAALKREVRWLVTGMSPDPSETSAVSVSDEIGLLLRRAGCPVLTVQRWAEPPASPPSVAVVGVDRSEQARAAAHAAAELLAAATTRARLILVHGSATHPAELAAHTPWRELASAMQVERHEWIVALAEELRTSELGVDVVVDLVFAPELIGGVARRAGADFTALGAAARAEGRRPRPGRIHQRVLLGTPSPLLTTTATGPPAGRAGRAGREQRGPAPEPI